MRIREAAPADAERLGFIHVKTWQEAYKGIVPEAKLDNMSAENSAEFFRENQDNDQNIEVGVAEIEKEVAGFITIGKCRDEDMKNNTGEIYGIYILPDKQGYGLGSELIKWGMKRLRNMDFETAVLWVLEANKESINFHRSKGFNREGREDYIEIGKKLKKIRMIKAL